MRRPPPAEARQSPTAHAQAKAEQITYERGLPAAPDAEVFTLGAILLDGALMESALELISADDFLLESNRRIFGCMAEVRESGERIDRLTVAEALRGRGWLESVGGLTFLLSLDEGIPQVESVEPWAKLIREKANLRRIMADAQRALEAASAGVTTSEEIATGLTERLQRIQVTSRDDGGKTPLAIIESFAGGVAEFMDPSLRKRGLPTGFTKLDEMLGGGLQDGELIILAGRPSMGKSAAAINIVSHLCLRQQKKCAFFSLETNGAHVLTRMMCAEARVDAHRFRTGYLNRDERSRLQVALGDIVECGLKVYEFSMTMPQIDKAARRLVKDEGFDLIVVDHLSLIPSSGKSENRNTEVGAMTRVMKLTAKDLGVPFLTLCQLNRSNERRTGDKVPILSDLRESGEIEQNADVVMFVHRPEVYRPQDLDLKGLAELYISKQRSGPLARIELSWVSGWTKFENRSRDMFDEPEA